MWMTGQTSQANSSTCSSWKAMQTRSNRPLLTLNNRHLGILHNSSRLLNGQSTQRIETFLNAFCHDNLTTYLALRCTRITLKPLDILTWARTRRRQTSPTSKACKIIWRCSPLRRHKSFTSCRWNRAVWRQDSSQCSEEGAQVILHPATCLTQWSTRGRRFTPTIRNLDHLLPAIIKEARRWWPHNRGKGHLEGPLSLTRRQTVGSASRKRTVHSRLCSASALGTRVCKSSKQFKRRRRIAVTARIITKWRVTHLLFSPWLRNATLRRFLQAIPLKAITTYLK